MKNEAKVEVYQVEDKELYSWRSSDQHSSTTMYHMGSSYLVLRRNSDTHDMMTSNSDRPKVWKVQGQGEHLKDMHFMVMDMWRYNEVSP
jgi:hypothetical protein